MSSDKFDREKADAEAEAIYNWGFEMAKEAAAKICDGWREFDWPENTDLGTIRVVSEDHAHRIRALAPKGEDNDH